MEKEYDVLVFETPSKRQEGVFANASKLGTVSNFDAYRKLIAGERGYFAYTLKGQKAWVSHTEMTKSWGKKSDNVNGIKKLLT